MAGIVGQSDYYGLPEQSRPEPPPEQHLAELLKKPPMFSGPAKLATEGYDDTDGKSDEWHQMEETYGAGNVHPRGPGEWDD